MKHVRPFALSFVLGLSLLTACTGTEGRKQRYLERGQTFFSEGNLDKARIEFRNALQIDPNNAQARYFVGRIAEREIKPRDALVNYQAAIEADPELIAARGALARIYFLGGMPDKAREVIEPGLAKAPNDAQLLTVRGGLRAQDGDLAGALADAEAAVKADPRDEVAIAFLAAQYGRQNRPDDAIALVRKAVEQLLSSVDLPVILAELLYQNGHRDEALQQLEKVANAHKTDLVQWQRLARLYLLEKNPDGAIAALRQAVVANPGSVDAKRGLVVLLGSQKGVPAAIVEMQKFVDADRKNAELTIALGQFLESAREPARAEALYREVIKSEGVKTQGLAARNRLAAMLVQKPDLPAAEVLIAEVLKENPRDNDSLVLRAGIAMSKRETTSAITDLRAVLRDQPDSVPLMRTLARAHLQDGDQALAEEVLRAAVQANPADAMARYDLASLLATSGRGKQALPVLEQIIKDAPDNSQAREAYFRLQMSLPDLAGARKTAEELKSLHPDQPNGSLLLGSLYESERKLPEATREYEYALKLSRDPGTALGALVRVDLLQKQPARAIGRIEAVIAQAPDFAPAHNLLGEAYLAASNPQSAIKAFDTAIGKQPLWWVPYRGKALAQIVTKQPDAVIATLNEGVTKTRALELYAALATAQEQKGSVDQAIATYEDALKRYPRALSVANNLAMLLVTHRAGDKASIARAAQVSALLEGSEQPALVDTLGWVKYHQGAIPESQALLQKAAERAPKSSVILYHLGMAQLRAGDRTGAKKNLESALAANANFQDAADARTALASLAGPG